MRIGNLPWGAGVCLFACLLGSGCGGDSKSGLGGFCEADGDCESGLECRENVCSEPLVNCEPPCNPDVEYCYQLECVVIADPDDKDGDGSLVGEDCDDFDRTVHPGSYEYCDGIDNDCDDVVDQDCPPCSDGDSRPCGSDVGECTEGTQTCAAGMWEPCSVAGPTQEKCDGKDNDCDGLTDEVCPCEDGEEYPCGGSRGECVTGTQVCTEGVWPGCMNGSLPADFEVCNGVDDDCDGLTDEGFDLGVECAGRGECEAGVRECAGDLEIICSTWPGASQDQSTAELCDGLDNDCDELTDEDFLVGEACQGAGECGPGVFECADLDNARCSSDPGGSQYAGVDELCDGKDNDCDGETDEGFGIGEACTGTGACGEGLTECADESSVRCSTNPGGSEDQSQAEVCDGATVDEDCDGEADEDFDQDGDGFYSCASHDLLPDCCDDLATGAEAYWGAEGWHEVPHACTTAPGLGWDYNCDGVAEKRWVTVASYSCGFFECHFYVAGWSGTVPECGAIGVYITGCHYDAGSISCVLEGYPALTQLCR
jgi:hypothetical protein